MQNVLMNTSRQASHSPILAALAILQIVSPLELENVVLDEDEDEEEDEHNEYFCILSDYRRKLVTVLDMQLICMNLFLCPVIACEGQRSDSQGVAYVVPVSASGQNTLFPLKNRKA